MSIEIKVPEMGESIIEATVANWLKQEGEPVTAGEPLVELETDKVNLDVSSEQDGILERIAHPAGDTVSVGDVLAILAESDGAAPASAAGQPEPEHQEPHGAAGEPSIQATPVAQRMAEEQGIQLSDVRPKGERITKQDVQAFMDQTTQTPEKPKPAPEAKPPKASKPAPQPERVASEPGRELASP